MSKMYKCLNAVCLKNGDVLSFDSSLKLRTFGRSSSKMLALHSPQSWRWIYFP